MNVKLSETTDFVPAAMWDVPRKQGVYLIHDLCGVRYIGKSIDIRRRFVQHMNYSRNIDLNTVVRNPVGPLKFSWIVTNQIDEKERELIKFFKPKCNIIKFKNERGN